MSLLLFLNEKSCTTHATPREVDAAMDEFIGALRMMRKWRKPALVSRAPLADTELAAGYPFRQWAADGRNRDKRLFLKGLRNRAPFSEVLPDQSARVEVEYLHAGESVEGLGAAHLMEGLAVSLPLGADDPWAYPWIDVQARTLTETDGGELDWREEDVAVRHGSRRAHVAEHEAWTRTEGLDAVEQDQLWGVVDDFFPHLQFLPRVREDLAALQRPWFVQVRKLLASLERSAAHWDPTDQPVPHWQGAKVTPEHEQRRRLCTFADLDGEPRCFDLHGRFTPGPGRLHFRLVPEEKSLRVAYVGRKLE